MSRKLKQPISLLLLLLLLGFVIRLYLAQFFTYEGDLYTFVTWGQDLERNGFLNFYSRMWSDYLPGYLYILTIVSKLHLSFPSLSNELIYKLPSILTDIGSAFFVFLIVKKYASLKAAFLTALLMLFTPAVLANSTFWGQADSFAAFFIISSLYFVLQQNFLTAGFILGFGQVVKPIIVLVIPFYLIYIFLQKQKVFNSLLLLIPFGVIILLSFIPFTSEWNLIKVALDRHLATTGQYPYTSLNAFNFWAIVNGFWYSDAEKFLSISLSMWGNILFGILYLLLLLVTLFKLKEAKNRAVFLAYAIGLCYFGLFVFLSRMHERHFFYGLATMTLILPILSWKSKIAIFWIHLFYFLNLAYAYSTLNGKPAMFNMDLVVVISFINIFVFGFLLVHFLRKFFYDRLV